MISLSCPTPVTSMRPPPRDLSPKDSHAQQPQQYRDSSQPASTLRLPSIRDLLGSVASNHQNLTQPPQTTQPNQWYNTNAQHGPAIRGHPLNAGAPLLGSAEQFSTSSQHSTNPHGVKRKFDWDASKDARYNEFRRVAPGNQAPPMQHTSAHRNVEQQIRPGQVPPSMQQSKFPTQQYRGDWFPPPQNRTMSDPRPSAYNPHWNQVAPVSNHPLSVSSSTQQHPYLQPHRQPQSHSPISRSPSPRRPQPYEQGRMPPRGRPSTTTATPPAALPSPQSSSTSSSTTRATTTTTTAAAASQPPSFAEVAPQISSLYSTRRKRATAEQLRVLNAVFEVTFFPSTDLRNQLARELGMSARTVQVWFQNKRSAHRSSILRSGGVPVATATPQQQGQQQPRNENDPVQRYREIAQRDAMLSGARGPAQPQGAAGPVVTQQGFARGSDKDRMYGRLLRMPEAALAHARGEKEVGEVGEGRGRGGSSSSISSGGSSRRDARGKKVMGDETQIYYDDGELDDDDDDADEEYVE